jgi:hypothetical protein
LLPHCLLLHARETCSRAARLRRGGGGKARRRRGAQQPARRRARGGDVTSPLPPRGARSRSPASRAAPTLTPPASLLRCSHCARGLAASHAERLRMRMYALRSTAGVCVRTCSPAAAPGAAHEPAPRRDDALPAAAAAVSHARRPSDAKPHLQRALATLSCEQHNSSTSAEDAQAHDAHDAKEAEARGRLCNFWAQRPSDDVRRTRSSARRVRGLAAAASAASPP